MNIVKLVKRFYSIKHRCGRGRDYHNVRFGFESAREAAEYMLSECGPLLPEMTIDRIDGRPFALDSPRIVLVATK